MNQGLIKVQWENLSSLKDEDISYYLFLEGKSPEAVSIIRNISLETAKAHILNGKIKYGIIARCRDLEELFHTLTISSKADKTGILSYLEQGLKVKLAAYISQNYADMLPKEKETAVWTLGELGYREGYRVLARASVHKFINIRRMAVSAMGKINDPYFEEALIKALEDSNPQVVFYAVKALQKMESDKAMEKIKNLYLNSDKDYLKQAAEKWLESRMGA
jgi:HEAT repeat protein